MQVGPWELESGGVRGAIRAVRAHGSTCHQVWRAFVSGGVGRLSRPRVYSTQRMLQISRGFVFVLFFRSVLTSSDIRLSPATWTGSM